MGSIGRIITVTAACALLFTGKPEVARAEGSASNVDRDGAWIGLFTEKGPEDMTEALSLQQRLGKSFASLMWFTDFDHPFPLKAAENATAAGAIPSVTWEPWFWSDKDRIHLDDINSGTWDSYISSWGAAAAAFGKPLFVRWGHEFNGDWYPWGIAKNGQAPASYVKAYRRVHDLVVRAGAKNVVWVWCPNAGSVPAESWNEPMAAYPGDEYVDWVAIDGYDFESNASFSDIFSKVYSQVIAKVDKPIYIGEFATGRTGKEKADWLREMNAALKTQFKGIKGLVYFSVRKERDWRIDDSPDSLAGAKEILSQPYYKSEAADPARLAEAFHRDYASLKTGGGTAAAAARGNLELRRASLDPAGNPDWSAVSPSSFAGKNDLSGTVKLAWDSERLYLQASIKNRYPQANKGTRDGIWNGDCLELCISTDPKADPARISFGSFDWQLGFAPADTAKQLPARSWEWSKLKSQIPGARVSSQPIEGGYLLEASFPWATLRDFRAEAGATLGFDFAVDDAGASGSRASQWIWNGSNQFYNNPAQWGTITLKP
jgi:Carbohydrate family 9 binding domain-like/Glycosyl hydrolase family 26